MSINLSGAPGTARAKLTGNTATALYTAQSRTTILSIVAVENAGSTPNLTIDVYDPSGSGTSYLLRRAVPLVSGEAFIFDQPQELPAGWSIRGTSDNASGHVDMHVTYINSTAATGR